MPSKLRFRARGESLVQNLEKLDAGIKSFIGRKFLQVEDRWAFSPTEADEEVAYRAEYVRACKDGDLWAADADTAAACGVRFDSNFGAAPPKSSPKSEKAEKG
jgi:hypothetical protein